LILLGRADFRASATSWRSWHIECFRTYAEQRKKLTWGKSLIPRICSYLSDTFRTLKLSLENSRFQESENVMRIVNQCRSESFNYQAKLTTFLFPQTAPTSIRRFQPEVLSGSGQQTKTSLRRAWVVPKTSNLPDGSRVTLQKHDLLVYDVLDLNRFQQSWAFDVGGVIYQAAVRVINAPVCGIPTWENFGICFCSEGKLIPSPAVVSRGSNGIDSGTEFSSVHELLRWWLSVPNAGIRRFLAWVAIYSDGGSTHYKFFDRCGCGYDNPYSIPQESRLVLPS
jgi:hypothetical protein